MQNERQRPHSQTNRHQFAAFGLGLAFLLWNLLAPLAHAAHHSVFPSDSGAGSVAFAAQTDVAHANSSCAFCIVGQQTNEFALPQPVAVACEPPTAPQSSAELPRLSLNSGKTTRARLAARAPPLPFRNL